MHWILLAILIVMLAVMLLALHWTPLGAMIRAQIADRPRRRLFLASVN